MTILNREEIYRSNDGFRRVRWWIAGLFPERGKLLPLGLSGKEETVVIHDIPPIRIFTVVEKTNPN